MPVVTLPDFFDVILPKGAKLPDGTATVRINIANWTDEKHAAVYGFALKESANNRSGGEITEDDGTKRKKTDSEIVALVTQDYFDKWTPETGSGGRLASAERLFVEAVRNALLVSGMPTAAVREALKGADRDEATRVLRMRGAAQLGADATESAIDRVLANRLARINASLVDDSLAANAAIDESMDKAPKRKKTA